MLQGASNPATTGVHYFTKTHFLHDPNDAPDGVLKVQIPPTSGHGGLEQAPSDHSRLSKHRTINSRDAREASGGIPRSRLGDPPGEVTASY